MITEGDYHYSHVDSLTSVPTKAAHLSAHFEEMRAQFVALDSQKTEIEHNLDAEQARALILQQRLATIAEENER